LLHPSFVFFEQRLSFQCVERGIEDPLKRLWERFELVILPFALAARFDEAGATKVGEMARDARLVGLDGAVEEANADFAFAHEIEETKTIHVRESGKEEGSVIHAFHIRVDEFVFK